MLDGDAEPGGGDRRVRTVSARLAAGGATARSVSPSLARAGATPEVAAGLSLSYLRSGRRPPSSSVRVADLRTSRHVRPSVAEVSELFFDGCNGSGSSVRTPPRSSASEQSAGMTLERHPNWLGRGERPSSSGAVDVRDVRRGGGSHARQIRPRTPPHTPLPNEQQQNRRSARATHSGSTPC